MTYYAAEQKPDKKPSKQTEHKTKQMHIEKMQLTSSAAGSIEAGNVQSPEQLFRWTWRELPQLCDYFSPFISLLSYV